LLTDREKMAEMGRQSRAIAEAEFDWKLIAAKTKQVYEDLLRQKRRIL
jgi:glycosyltransferase involved in cell wall biosynthesis